MSLALLIPSMVLAAALAPPETNLERLLAAIRNYDYGMSREPLEDFNAWVRARSGNPTDLAAAERGLAALLDARPRTAVADFALRQLALIGTPSAVPAIAPWLADPKLGETARLALDRIPGEAASQALRDALPNASPRVKAGILHSLGSRGDKASLPLLRRYLAQPDKDLGAAAAAGLAAMASAESCRALGVSHPGALIDCAAGLVRAGDRKTAADWMRRLLASPNAAWRPPALYALSLAAGEGAFPEVRRALASPDASMRLAAVDSLEAIPGAASSALLVETARRPDAPTQARALVALERRREASALPIVLELAQSAEGTVKLVAVEALGVLGDQSAVPLLARLAAGEGQLAEQVRLIERARESLYRLPGAPADKAIVALLARSTGRERLALIRAAGERGIGEAAPALVGIAGEPEAEARREALRALAATARPNDIPALAALLERASSSDERQQAQSALAATLARAGGAGIEAVMARARAAAPAEARQALYSVLAGSGHAEALALLRRSLASADRDTKRAAIIALGEWPTPEPLADLLGIARNEQALALQVLALRGFTRLAALTSSRPDAESAALVEQALAAARRAEEKRALIALLPRFNCEEARRIAARYASDAEVGAEAKAALDRMNRAEPKTR